MGTQEESEIHYNETYPNVRYVCHDYVEVFMRLLSITLISGIVIMLTSVEPSVAQEEDKQRQAENNKVLAPLPDGEGKKILASQCVMCHGLGRVESGQKSLKSWTNTIKVMIVNGATLDNNEVEPLAQYLAANFSLRVNVNTASLEELATVPGIDAKLAAAIVRYRDKNGSFEKLEDLTKVDGITPEILKNISSRITVGVRPGTPEKK